MVAVIFHVEGFVYCQEPGIFDLELFFVLVCIIRACIYILNPTVILIMVIIAIIIIIIAILIAIIVAIIIIIITLFRL